MPITPDGNVFDNTTNIVYDGWNHFRSLGDSWVTQTRSAIIDLDKIYVDPINFSVDFNVDAYAPRFMPPTKPADLVVSNLSVSTPLVPTLDAITLREIGDAPVDPDLSTYIDYAPPSAPTTPLPIAPTDYMPVMDTIVVPDRPTYVLPELPTLYALNLPTVPVITLPEFDGVRPVFDIDMPVDGELEFVEQAYSSDLLDEMKGVLRTMMQGGSGLPLAVEAAIFDRGRAREDRLSRKQLQEVDDDMGSRGLTEPNGIHARRLREVHADNREKASGLNRDLTIRTAELAIEGVKFAMAQGMALEQTLIQLNESINDRALKVALFAREYGITRLNAMIAYANLQQQAYATDAQVWEQRIRGELAKLEILKAEIDAQRLIGEINKDLVSQYVAQYEGLKALADFYRTDVEAAKAKGEINNQRLEAGKLVLQKFETEVSAWGKVQDGYKNQIDASLGRVRFGETLATIFATRMQGYKTKGESYFNEGQFQLAKNGQTLELFRAQLQGSEQDLRAQLGRIDAEVRTYGAKMDGYQTEGTVAQAESAALDRSTQLKVEIERNRTSVALENAKMPIDQMMEAAKILVEQIKAKAAALAQLTAASQSGVNLGASISASGSFGVSHSRSVGWSGEADDYTGGGGVAY